MAVKIRLMRIGATKRPFYRVVTVDERQKRNGAYIELLGTYNPLSEPKEVILKQDRIDEWIKNGAQMSDGFLRVIGKAPQRPARKVKKEKKTTANSLPTTASASEETGAQSSEAAAKQEEAVSEDAAAVDGSPEAVSNTPEEDKENA